jgi:hypothetical protein
MSADYSAIDPASAIPESSSKASYRERWGQFASGIRESVSLITIGLIWPYRFHRQGM